MLRFVSKKKPERRIVGWAMSVIEMIARRRNQASLPKEPYDARSDMFVDPTGIRS
jgi:hypothetical protein